MNIGIVFPQTEYGPDPEPVRTFATTVEELGYDHLLAYDHVLGADPESPLREEWEGPYDYEDPFHEPLTLFSHVAAVTDDIDLVTGVLILPQRQTALVAKQAAEVDLLSSGRLRLGVGIGWNEVEYEALGKEFSDRGRRVEEQIDVLRRLWRDDLVDFEGEDHRIPDAGIRPLPEGDIPIWMGGEAEPALERAGRMADGWLPLSVPGHGLEPKLETVRESAREAGRDPDDLAILGHLRLRDVDEDDWISATERWIDAGATHMSVSTIGLEVPPAEHVETIARFRERLVDAGIEP